MVTGALGVVTPLVASSVATRLTVLAAPTFWNANAAVTVSPASSVPLGGTTLSDVKLTPGTRMIGAGFNAVEMTEAKLLAKLPSDARPVTRAVLVTEPAV